MDIQHIGRYEILGELGAGGMATVLLGKDSFMDREVAIKLLPKLFMHDPTFKERFQREAKLLAQLEHSAIVPVYDFGYHEEQPYMVNRYMRGGTLLARISEQGALSINESLTIISRVCSALDAAHKRGTVHRDVKPANILFDDTGQAFIADFGIAKLAQSTSTLTGNTLVGTPAYMSPEQFSGEYKVDGRSDQYSLAIVLFEMLSGELPFKGDTTAKLMKNHLMDSPPNIHTLRGDLPEGIEQIINRMLRKNPDQRYPRINHVVEELNQITEFTHQKEFNSQDFTTRSMNSSVQQDLIASTQNQNVESNIFATNIVEDIPTKTPELANELAKSELQTSQSQNREHKLKPNSSKRKPNLYLIGAYCLIIVGVILQPLIPYGEYPNIPLIIFYGSIFITPLLITGFFAINTQDFQAKRLVSLYSINLLLSIVLNVSAQSYIFRFLYNQLSPSITRSTIGNIDLLIRSLIFSAMITMAVIIYRRSLDSRIWKRILVYIGPPLFYIIFYRFLNNQIARILNFDQTSGWLFIFRQLIFYLGILSLAVPLFLKPSTQEQSDGMKPVKTNDMHKKDR